MNKKKILIVSECFYPEEFKIKHLTRVTNNLQSSKIFYEKYLGMSWVRNIEIEGSPAIVMDSGAVEIYLKHTSSKIDNPTSIQPTSDHWAFAVRDIAYAEGILNKNNVEFIPIKVEAMAGKPAVRQTFFQDPDGHLLEITLDPTAKPSKMEESSSLKTSNLHHISRSVTRAYVPTISEYYGSLLNLKSIKRPNFDLPGTWFKMGSIEIHFIGVNGVVCNDPTIKIDNNLWAFSAGMKKDLDHGESDAGEGISPDRSGPIKQIYQDGCGKLVEIFLNQ